MSSSNAVMTLFNCSSRSGACFATRFTISSYTLGCSVANARSSNSHLMVFIPSRCASGAKISSVSVDFCFCFAGDNQLMVRMLCNRSASLITITRMS